MIKIDEKNFEKINKWAFLMNAVPFLRGSFVCNSYAIGTADEKSDIDLFVVTKRNRLYTARFYMNLLFRIFRVRTYGDDVASKFCLSFFADEDNLNFTSIAKRKDFYFAYWIYTLRPIINRNIHGKPVSEQIIGKNFWARDLLGMTNADVQNTQLDLTFARDKFFFSNVFRKFFEIISVGFLGAFFESILRKIQIRKIRKRLKKIDRAEKINSFGKAVSSADVLLKKGILKLHENDQRVAFRDAYISKYGDKFNEDNFISLLTLSQRSRGK